MHPTMYLHLYTSSAVSECFAVCMRPFYALLHCKCITCIMYIIAWHMYYVCVIFMQMYYVHYYLAYVLCVIFIRITL